MCSVLRCDSSRRGAQRFKLPEDAEKRLEWVQFVLEVNGQRLKESCWTEISICREHFTDDCFGGTGPTGTAQLKPGAVPTLFIKSEPDQPEPDQVRVKEEQDQPESDEVKAEPDQVKVEPDQPEPDQPKSDQSDGEQPEPDQPEPDQPQPDYLRVEPDQEPLETQDCFPQCEQLETGESPSYCSEGSIESNHTSPIGAPVNPQPSESSDEDYGQMVQKIENIAIIKKKVQLLQMQGKYVVNENRILELFSTKCPLCGSKVKLDKATQGEVIAVNQQCLQCDYRRKWKSQMPSEGGDPVDELGESSDQRDVDSDEDWRPIEEPFPDSVLSTDSDEESELEEEEKRELCTECGKFVMKLLSHACEHKTKPYSCNICGKRCVNEFSRSLHSKIHDEDYEYRCKYCNATLKTKQDKLKHEQIHQDKKDPYKCPTCLQTFATNKARRVHMSKHKAGPEWKCGVCGLEFKGRHALQRHTAVHTGLKPHQCSVCQRHFTQSSHLKSHMRLHTGERPYKCRHCDKGFNHNVSLKSHVQRYHTSRSGQKKGKGKVSERARETESTRGPDSDSDSEEEEGDTEEEVQEKVKVRPKRRPRSSGRPKGRPKRNMAANLVVSGQNKDGHSSSKTSKSKLKKKTGSSDEESECEQSDGNMSFDSEEVAEEEEKETVTKRNRGRSRKRPNNDSDSSFHPEEEEKEQKMKRSSQNNGQSRRGRRKTAVV